MHDRKLEERIETTDYEEGRDERLDAGFEPKWWKDKYLRK